jgi:hypothetical protein
MYRDRTSALLLASVVIEYNESLEILLQTVIFECRVIRTAEVCVSQV